MPGLRLCGACLRQTEKNLTALPALYDECADHVFGGPRNPTRQRVTGTRDVAPLNDSAIETRSNISEVLASWASTVVEEKGIPAPGPSVGSLTGFLVRQLTWLGGHVAAVLFADETENLVTEARRTLDPAPDARLVTLGLCVEPGCSEILSAAEPGQRISASRGISCTAGHSWQAHEWFLLQSRIEQKGEVGTA
ncbi:hypothetical protein [Streptomyces sp. NPDC058653]|uniref:hypothetical protein n=1 Tax=Streptomyces sp. NPDC058653 TaxID=3346576 RepID=UPI0036610327